MMKTFQEDDDEDHQDNGGEDHQEDDDKDHCDDGEDHQDDDDSRPTKMVVKITERMMMKTNQDNDDRTT